MKKLLLTLTTALFIVGCNWGSNSCDSCSCEKGCCDSGQCDVQCGCPCE